MMTQEEKQLVLIDISARWPFGVIVSPLDCGKARVVGFKGEYPLLFDLTLQKEYERPWEIEYIKPYLRPLSSMTEEEVKELYILLFEVEKIGFPDIYEGQNAISSLYDWLNKKMFDYRGLIPKGLALIAPEGMYKEEQQ